MTCSVSLEIISVESLTAALIKEMPDIDKQFSMKRGSVP